MFLENVLLAPLSTPESGMTFVAAYDACVFPAPHSWKVLYKIAQGTRVTVAGTPKSCDGDIMAPWQRRVAHVTRRNTALSRYPEGMGTEANIVQTGASQA